MTLMLCWPSCWAAVFVKLMEHLDRLGFDEFWCGEHHSSGWKTIASPEMFLAAAGERSKRSRLRPPSAGSGVEFQRAGAKLAINQNFCVGILRSVRTRVG
jgi:hypothetical protein